MKNGAYLILLAITTGVGISTSASADPTVTNYKQYTRLSQVKMNAVNVVKEYDEDEGIYDIVNDRSYEKDGLRFSVQPNVISGNSPQTLYRYIGKAPFKIDSSRKRHWSKSEDWRSNHRKIVVGSRLVNMPGRTGDYFFGEEEVTCAEAQKTELEKFLASSAGAQLKSEHGLKEVTVLLNIVAAAEKRSTPANLAEAEGLGGWKPARFQNGALLVSPVFQNVQKRSFLGFANDGGAGDFKYVESNCFVSPAADIENALSEMLDKKPKAMMASGRLPEAAKVEGKEWDRQREQLQWRTDADTSVSRRNGVQQ